MTGVQTCALPIFVHLCDGLFHVENLLCGLAADEVALVLSGHGADHIGTFSAGFTQDVLGSSVAGANGNIELVRDHTAQFPVLLDYGGLVTLRTQGLRKVESHLAAADYDYFHDFSSKFTRPAERSRHSRRAGPGAAAYLVDTSADIVAAYLKPPCHGARGLTVVSHIAQAVVGHPLRRADLRRLEHQPVKRNVLMDDVEIPQHAVGGHCPLKVYLGGERTYSGLLKKLPYGCFAAGLAAYGAASAALPPAAAGFLRNTLGEKYMLSLLPFSLQTDLSIHL